MHGPAAASPWPAWGERPPPTRNCRRQTSCNTMTSKTESALEPPRFASGLPRAKEIIPRLTGACCFLSLLEGLLRLGCP